ncbi:MAG TPA: GNAT family N-acetyltransferase [Verrucomicrobiae bacterium]|jgi:RimJ/RimL family protein N-acetyltransferase
MRHDLTLSGFGFGLRPVEEKDAEFIVEIRTADPERTRFLHPIPPDAQAQREWIARYLQRENDYYWVVQRLDNGQSEGVIGIYDINPTVPTAEWGRWVLRHSSLAAPESALLVYRAAFELIKLESIYCMTVADNKPVVSFHDSCGLRREGTLKEHFKLGEKSFDAVKHVLDRKDWQTIRDRLSPIAQMTSRRIHKNR